MSIEQQAGFDNLLSHLDSIARSLAAIAACMDEDQERRRAAARAGADAEFERLSVAFRRASQLFAMADRRIRRHSDWDRPTEGERERAAQLEQETGDAETALEDFVRLHPEYQERYGALFQALADEVLA